MGCPWVLSPPPPAAAHTAQGILCTVALHVLPQQRVCSGPSEARHSPRNARTELRKDGAGMARSLRAPAASAAARGGMGSGRTDAWVIALCYQIRLSTSAGRCQSQHPRLAAQLAEVLGSPPWCARDSRQASGRLVAPVRRSQTRCLPAVRSAGADGRRGFACALSRPLARGCEPAEVAGARPSDVGAAVVASWARLDAWQRTHA